ncbi:MAG: zf-HC2 domain-containing protein [Bacteroidetes bacterium]|nr:zf-HC2 domain-containing protein [Bacteroidota bacterium]
MLNRRCNKIESLLIEYLEGSLTIDNSKLVEEHIINCSSCNNVYQDCKLTFEVLKKESSYSIPQNYFSNLPALIQNKISTKKIKFTFPIFSFRFSESIAAIFVIGLIPGLYFLLNDSNFEINNNQFNSEAITEVELNENHYSINLNNEYYFTEKDKTVESKLYLQILIPKDSHKEEMALELNDVILDYLLNDLKTKSEYEYIASVY